MTILFPKVSQSDPRAFPECPKSAPRGPRSTKRPPKGAKTCPGGDQERPKSAQDGTKTVPREPKSALRGAKRLSRRSRETSRRPRKQAKEQFRREISIFAKLCSRVGASMVFRGWGVPGATINRVEITQDGVQEAIGGQKSAKMRQECRRATKKSPKSGPRPC